MFNKYDFRKALNVYLYDDLHLYVYHKIKSFYHFKIDFGSRLWKMMMFQFKINFFLNQIINILAEAKLYFASTSMNTTKSSSKKWIRKKEKKSLELVKIRLRLRFNMQYSADLN